MDGFKDTTRMKYMTGGTVKKAMGGACGPVKKAMGGTINEKGKRASLAEMEAEDRRMGSKMVTKKPMAKGSGIMPAALAASKKVADMTKKGVPSYSDKPMIRRKAGGLACMPKKK